MHSTVSRYIVPDVIVTKPIFATDLILIDSPSQHQPIYADILKRDRNDSAQMLMITTGCTPKNIPEVIGNDTKRSQCDYRAPQVF